METRDVLLRKPSGSLERFLGQTATRGSWYGGGSTAAAACALAAALLEKLSSHSPDTRRLRLIRRTCMALTHRDAETFAAVIQAKSRGDRRAFRRAMKTAIEIPWQVCASSRRLLAVTRRLRHTIPPRLQADLRCATALARASEEAARALVSTNLAWLGDRATSRRFHRKMARHT